MLDVFRQEPGPGGALLQGLFFGRIANFINGELWGKVTDSPLGMVFCNDTIKQT